MIIPRTTLNLKGNALHLHKKSRTYTYRSLFQTDTQSQAYQQTQTHSLDNTSDELANNFYRLKESVLSFHRHTSLKINSPVEDGHVSSELRLNFET